MDIFDLKDRLKKVEKKDIDLRRYHGLLVIESNITKTSFKIF